SWVTRRSCARQPVTNRRTISTQRWMPSSPRPAPRSSKHRGDRGGPKGAQGARRSPVQLQSPPKAATHQAGDKELRFLTVEPTEEAGDCTRVVAQAVRAICDDSQLDTVTRGVGEFARIVDRHDVVGAAVYEQPRTGRDARSRGDGIEVCDRAD